MKIKIRSLLQCLSLSGLLLAGYPALAEAQPHWGGHANYQQLLENEGEALRLPVEAWPADLKIRTQTGKVIGLQTFLDLPTPAFYTKEVQVYRLSDQPAPVYLVIPNRAFFNQVFYLPTLQSQGQIILPKAIHSEPTEPLQELYRVKHAMDLTGDGQVDLIYESNSGASSYQTTQHILWWDGKQYRTQILFQFLQLYDFEQDGKIELVLGVPAEFAGATSVSHAHWTYWDDIYRWNGKQFVLASKAYPNYYSQIAIPRYQQQIEALKKQGSDADIKQAIRARQQAIQWAQQLSGAH